MKPEELMKEVSIVNSHIGKLEKSLPEMVKLKMRSPKTGFDSPKGSFGVYKSTGGRCLGVVGRINTPTQPKFLLNTVLNTVLQHGDIFDLSTVKYKERKEGTRIEFSVDMQEFEVPTKLKVGDITKLSLLFSTQYNNKQSNRIDLYTTRCWCDNQHVRKFLTSTLKVRNTGASEDIISKYFYDIAVILKEVDGYKSDMLKLAAKNVSKADIESVVCKAFKIKEDVKERKSAQIKKHEKVMVHVNKELKDTGKTAYGLFQGLTNYLNHSVAVDKGDDYLISGRGFKLSQIAEKAVMELIN